MTVACLVRNFGSIAGFRCMGPNRDARWAARTGRRISLPPAGRAAGLPGPISPSRSRCSVDRSCHRPCPSHCTCRSCAFQADRGPAAELRMDSACVSPESLGWLLEKTDTRLTSAAQQQRDRLLLARHPQRRRLGRRRRPNKANGLAADVGLRSSAQPTPSEFQISPRIVLGSILADRSV